MMAFMDFLMPHLSPQTLTRGEQRAILRATARNRRDHLIYSLALGTGLRLAEIVGLNVGDVYTPAGKPKNRIRLRREIAKGGRSSDVFLPDSLVMKLRRFWGDSSVSGTKGLGRGGSPVLLAVPEANFAAARSVRLSDVAGQGWLRPPLSLPRAAPHGRHECLSEPLGIYFSPRGSRGTSRR